MDPAETEHEFGIRPETTTPAAGSFDAIVLVVPHVEFLDMGAEAIRELGR